MLAILTALVWTLAAAYTVPGPPPVLRPSVTILWSTPGAWLRAAELELADRGSARILEGPLGDDELELDEGSEVLLLESSDTIVHAYGPGRLRFDSGRTRSDDGTVELRKVRLLGYREGELSDTGQTATRRPVSAGDGGTEVRCGAPRETAIEELDPPLSWTWPAAEGRFSLTLWELLPGHELRVVEHWRGLAGRSHTLWKPLTTGRLYRWQVMGLDGLGAPIAPGAVSWFRVLGDEERRRLEGSLAVLEGVRVTDDTGSRGMAVLKARLLESFQMYQRAETVWRALAWELPNRDDVREQLARVENRVLALPPRRVTLPFGIVVTMPAEPVAPAP